MLHLIAPKDSNQSKDRARITTTTTNKISFDTQNL